LKSININDFIQSGYVLKTHGTQGEIKLTSDYPIKKWAFLQLHGKPVPFYIESIKHILDNEYIAKLKWIDTAEAAQQLIGYNMLHPSKKRKSDITADDVVGYRIIDAEKGDIGIIESIEELPMQLMLHISYKNKPCMIPAVEAFISDINHNKKIIYTNLPEGLLDV
jgi:16S rRNA processing protein RimM